MSEKTKHDPLDDLPKIHEREEIVNAAELKLLEAVIKVRKDHDLTTGETIRVLMNVLGGQIQGIAKYAIRHERHGDEDKPGGLE